MFYFITWGDVPDDEGTRVAAYSPPNCENDGEKNC